MCHMAGVWLRRQIMEYDPSTVYVFIENPFISPKTVKAALPLARINGALHAYAYGTGCHVQGVDISRWKKIVVGKGTASKTEIKRCIREIWPAVYREAGGDQDLLDAAAINRYGSKTLTLRNRIEQSREHERATA
jgi:Holliday junction resolvasome RuvABC endonuclease subunit